MVLTNFVYTSVTSFVYLRTTQFFIIEKGPEDFFRFYVRTKTVCSVINVIVFESVKSVSFSELKK